jgi:[acyl-carrier-protein] S-malonyltransferase
MNFATGGSGIAAWVDGEAIPADAVAAELDRMREGPLASRLPPNGTADARQLRRWVTQRVVLRRLLEREAAARALPPAPGPHPDPALLGSAAADVLATSPAARAVLATFERRPSEDEIRASYAAGPDRYARPERWLVRQAFVPDRVDAPPDLPLGPVSEVDPAVLLPELRARPDGPVRSPFGWHLLVVDAVRPAGPVPYDEVRGAIAAELSARQQQLAFARWLDEAVARRIRLAPGFEHPADPRQPDATHRH